jgi:hypothetical protein
MPYQQPTSRTLSPWLLLPLAALLTILPLLLHGPSCGHDQGFHLVGWLDAAAQLRHGHYPRWAISPAWNAGEPRFLFYPPLSWLLGALLTLVLPANAAPIAYIFLALAASGLTMYRLAREFAAPQAALLAAAFYIANPYMLFNAFERSAFAELLAAAWIPLLMLAVLRAKPTVRGIAIPLALLWLTNAPAAVMGSYMFAVLAAYRLIQSIVQRLPLRREIQTESRQSDEPYNPLPITGRAFGRTDRSVPWHSWHLETSQPPPVLTLTYLTGTVLGLALPAFYLLPAAIQRRNIQVEMAVIPNMRFQDNFLFDNTADAGHNGVNHAISLLAVALLAITVLAVAILLLQRKRTEPTDSGAPFMRSTWRMSGIATALTLLTVLITLLLFPVSTPLWNHVPELAFLQFPWRLLTILSAVLALALALIFNQTLLTGAPFMRGLLRMSGVATTLLIPTTLTFLMYAHTAQGCELRDRPTSIASSLATGHGVSPTDEYTPNKADNDILRTGNPGYWLAAHPTDPAPNTVPTPTELNPAANTDDFPIPFAQTLSTPAPHHIQLHANQPGYLVLNLRDYPNWQVSTGCPTCRFFKLFPHIHRDDGLIVIAVPTGNSAIDIHWHRTWDQNLGLALTCLALLDLILAFFVTRSRTRPS